MKNNNIMKQIYSGSSVIIHFTARDASGNLLDISEFNKKVFVFGMYSKHVELDLDIVSNSSFKAFISGDRTKSFGSGQLNVLVELSKGEDRRIGKTTPLSLISPISSNGGHGNTIILDKGCVNAPMTLSNAQISIEMTMGSTLVYEGVDPAVIPTRLSQLDNDTKFITLSEVPEFPKKLSQFDNDENFITSDDIPSIPTSTNDLENNSGFITAEDIPVIPTKTSELTNDSGYITSESLPTRVGQLENDKNYATTNQIPTNNNQLENGAGYITASDIPTIPFEQTNKTFIDLWNIACGTYGKYNLTTKLFELNGLTDLTYDDAVQTYNGTALMRNSIDLSYTRNVGTVIKGKYRTNLQSIFWRSTEIPISAYFSDMEVINIVPYNNDSGYVSTKILATGSKLRVAFGGCPNLRKVIGVLNIELYSASALTGSYTMPLLQEIKISNLKYTTDFLEQAPKVDLPSFTHLVENSANTMPIIVKVHADIYAKLTDGANYPDWANLVTIAQANNITFAV